MGLLLKLTVHCSGVTQIGDMAVMGVFTEWKEVLSQQLYSGTFFFYFPYAILKRT